MTAFLTKKYIKDLSYTDFIALINQTNVPPGSFTTLTRWRVNSFICKESNVFDVASTTGFSLLNIVVNSGCTGTGVDISEPSVLKAIENSKQMNVSNRVKFHFDDATTYKSNEKFSHIILGASLGFFKNMHLTLENLTSLVGDSAYILASPFYAIKEMPQEIINRARQILGITPTIKDYKEVMKLYNKFEVHYEDRVSPIKETEHELKHYCESTIDRAIKELGINDDSITYDSLYKRLYDIRDICNKLREYQNYSVLVLKYSRGNFSKRYVEFF